ncbi:MAG: hypothetical protein WEA34_06545 [Gemmatimonadota bacterium]
MTRTIEDQVSLELDTLWQAALFLAGGEPRGAESLLVDTVVAASEDYLRVAMMDGASDAVERLMLRRFFDHTPWLPQGRALRGSRDVPEDVDDLLRSAGSIPPRSRAALWLVVIRRKPYVEGADILGIDGEELRGLLEHRETLMAGSHRVVTRRKEGSP